MGAWGPDSFDNDAALDFLAEVENAESVIAAFDLPPAGQDEVDADEASRVLAAAELVAIALGRVAASVPDEAIAAARRIQPVGDDLVDLAREAVSRVLLESELLELWAESDAGGEWNLAVTRLIDRLNPEIPHEDVQKADTSPIEHPCAFCGESSPAGDLLTVTIRQGLPSDLNQVDRVFFGHLDCLNARLHPRYMIQSWKVDPEKL